jgi:hypothetical protein
LSGFAEALIFFKERVMTATVMDMTGRVLDDGETVTKTLREKQSYEEMREIWMAVPEMVREWADGNELDYPAAVELMIHSLLSEAKQGAKQHERAQQVLDFVGERFFKSGD